MNKRIDLTGQRFGRLVALEFSHANKRRRTYWKCLCDCGGLKVIRSDCLLSGNNKSCGCLHGGGREVINLKGQIFGRLEVIKSDHKDKRGKIIWKCKCICGNTSLVTTQMLRRKQTVSCGCYQKELRQLPAGIGAFNKILGQYKRGAKKSKRSFSLSKKQFKEITSQNCYYCGCQPSTSYGDKPNHHCNGSFVYNGIDRIDNNRGYIKNNIVPCCTTCNIMKRNHSQKDFLAHVERIHKHQHNSK